MHIPPLRRSSRTTLLASGLFMLVISQSGVLAESNEFAGQCDAHSFAPIELTLASSRHDHSTGQDRLGINKVLLIKTID